MAGTFPGISFTQQSGISGEPLVGGILTVYNGGTTVLSNVFQDIGLAIPGANPMFADASGRLPLFFVADGTYRVRLTDAFGSTANGGFDYPQIPSIGASSSGGGGTAVDPNSIYQTGDFKFQLNNQPLAGFVRLWGGTIGNAASGASERSNIDCLPLFSYLWPNTLLAVSGGRGASPALDFAAPKTIVLPSMQGFTCMGLETGLGRIPATVPVSQGSITTPWGIVGEPTHQLTVAELANHPHRVWIYDPTHGHTGTTTGQVAGSGSGAQPAPGVGFTTGTITINANATGVRTSSDGGASPTDNTEASGGNAVHNNTGFAALGTFYMKL